MGLFIRAMMNDGVSLDPERGGEGDWTGVTCASPQRMGHCDGF